MRTTEAACAGARIKGDLFVLGPKLFLFPEIDAAGREGGGGRIKWSVAIERAIYHYFIFLFFHLLYAVRMCGNYFGIIFTFFKTRIWVHCYGFRDFSRSIIVF